MTPRDTKLIFEAYASTHSDRYYVAEFQTPETTKVIKFIYDEDLRKFMEDELETALPEISGSVFDFADDINASGEEYGVSLKVYIASAYKKSLVGAIDLTGGAATEAHAYQSTIKKIGRSLNDIKPLIASLSLSDEKEFIAHLDAAQKLLDKHKK